ncbi:MAG: hypothetical protein V3V23_06625, partial [Dehalococcoidales bacterium]
MSLTFVYDFVNTPKSVITPLSVDMLSRDDGNRYNQGVKVERLHHWQVSLTEALDIQRRLAEQVSATGEVISPRFIAGVDISAPKAPGMATGAVVVLSYPELRVV